MKHLLIVILIALVLVCGCTQQPDTSMSSDQQKVPDDTGTMRMSVSKVINGSTLPVIYTCAGPGQVPAVQWKGVPDAARSMVLIMDDPDAPDGSFTHWIVYNLYPDSCEIPPNQLPISEQAGSGLQGINSLKTRGYIPPCPPGGASHRYVFTLSALDTSIMPAVADREHIESAMDGHVIGTARIVTVFGQ